MSVYGYCRVALANEKEMEQQRERIVHYCRMNHLEVDECFCDNGVSGFTLDRAGLQQMLNHLKKGDVVVVKDAARLTRNMYEYMMLEKRFSDIGATLKVIE